MVQAMASIVAALGKPNSENFTPTELFERHTG
jgi:hypothetical protein